jgi:enoyl-CoA hydratase/carnithine racemase
MTYEEIVAERRDRVGIVTLNRPEKRNALGGTMSREIRDAVDAFNADEGIGAVVITGADPAFCGGADVGDWKRDLDHGTRESSDGLSKGSNWVDFFSSSKPIVCAVNGPSIGAGLTITLSCDARIASDRARFSMRFVRIGLIPELASTKLLPLIVGFSRALEMMLTGKTIDAQEAERIGLVSRVVPHDRLLEEAVALAADMAFNPTESLLAIKKLTWANLVEADLHKVMTDEAQELMAAALRPTFGEAVNAFLEKRQPDFHKSRC